MYKVLIIDDEEPSREAIRILGDWENIGVTEIIEATDGQVGITKVREYKPDIVLVDMKMPLMTGTEFLQIVQQDYPDIFTIVISGFNDFEYTKQAIQSKALDYLLKPVNKMELNQALLNAIDTIKAKRKRDNAFIDSNITVNISLPKLKEKIYISILEETFNKETGKEYLAMIGAGDNTKSFGAAILRIMNLEEIKRSRFKNQTDLLYFAITNVINEVGSDSFHCFSFANPRVNHEIAVIFLYEGGYCEEINILSSQFMKKVVKKLNELFNIKALGSIGHSTMDVIALAGSFKMAKTVLSAINLLELKESIYCADTIKEFAESHSITNRYAFIKNALEDSNQTTLVNIVNEYSSKIKKSGYFSLGNADRTLSEFFIILNDISLEFGVPQNEISRKYEISLKAQGESNDFATFENFEKILYRILNYYSEQIKHALKSIKNFNIHDIKEYLHNNYFETIKISMFTQKYYLSREYLMKLFKQEYGCGIHEYVQRIRMEKAQELLSDPNLKIQTISEMLGYSDKNYFSKAFKNYYRLSPSDYRLMQMEKVIKG